MPAETLSGFLMILLMIAFFYFFLIRPENKKKKEAAAMRESLKVGDQITRLPEVNEEAQCTGCGMCVASCSGQAIFLVDEDVGGGFATVTMPYELLP